MSRKKGRVVTDRSMNERMAAMGWVLSWATQQAGAAALRLEREALAHDGEFSNDHQATFAVGLIAYATELLTAAGGLGYARTILATQMALLDTERGARPLQ